MYVVYHSDKFRAFSPLLVEGIMHTPQLSMLETLASIIDSNPWIPWDEKVIEKVVMYHQLKKKLKSQSELPNYRNELLKAERDLVRIRGEKHLFIKSKIKDAENKVLELKKTIASLEKAASYELPKTNIEY